MKSRLLKPQLGPMSEIAILRHNPFWEQSTARPEMGIGKCFTVGFSAPPLSERIKIAS
jgi:hypothetical protein